MYRLACLLLTLVVSATVAYKAPPSRWENYFLNNVMPSGLPLSFNVPSNYFQSVPDSEKPHFITDPQVVPACNHETVSADALNAYMFQTEELLSAAGLNLYDAAVFTIAETLYGHYANAQHYETNNLLQGKTLQFQSIRATATCMGVIYEGTCSDPQQVGRCGFCYGNSLATLPGMEAYFFRMISDIYAFDGTVDVRCPALKHPWTWNDYRPVTGENAWAHLLGPMQVAWINAGGNPNNIDDSSVEMQLATSFMLSLNTMLIPSVGAVYYCPYNTYDVFDPNIGATVSTENNASLLAGLKAFLAVLQGKPSSKYANYIPQIQWLIQNIMKYLQSAYDPSLGYFRQGGRFDIKTGQWSWSEGFVPTFAVDCQTWVTSVLGLNQVDSWFGEGTAYNLWQTTKKLGGYKCDPNTKMCQGLGFTNNTEAGVFSGEWTFGGVNMLRVLANQYAKIGQNDMAQQLTNEANIMRQSIENELSVKTTFKNGATSDTVIYANKRYWIPFGWYANPIPSTASTAWAVMADANYNPFYIGGAYDS